MKSQQMFVLLLVGLLKELLLINWLKVMKVFFWKFYLFCL